MKNTRKLRLFYTVVFLALLLIEAGIALFVHDRFVRPYVGDMLVVLVVYSIVRIVLPCGVRRLPLYVFLFAAVVEGMQYAHLASILGLDSCRIARVVLGTVADWKDVVCYGVGCLALWGWEQWSARHEAKLGQ